jgi:ribosomal protein S18 acetylase RimI-like enzyme
MIEVKIVKPQREHFLGIISLLRQLWKDKELNERRLGEVFESGLSSGFQEFRIAMRNDKIVGFVSLTIRNSLWQEGYLGHIDELVVDERFRGNGVGTRLLDEMMKVSKKRSCKKIELDSAFHRKKAHTFYESKGFKNRAFVFSKDL